MATGDHPNAAPKPGGKKTKKLIQKEQSERFIGAARDLEADESGASFARVLKRIVPEQKRR